MEAVIDILFILAGLVCLLIGLAKSMMVLVIIGIILLALGGVWLIFIACGDGGFDDLF